MKILIEERWVISQLQPVSHRGNPIAQAKQNFPVVLQGFHPSTKVLRHTYGPFDSPTELEEFAALHGIKITGGRS